ncbi:hypothetical protein [Salmonirosea aquatica]|uniref:DUF4097 family beta strand repeat protein n=1 Tax=Salmonirosea aquatica TaxID=2654236 RepID=A0A7C9FQ62_9BACT|nr:hypothetical protein [Cytophagaceae bacterium SJW1-29]
MKIRASFSTMLLVLGTWMVAQAEQPKLIEKRKSVVKVYTVDSRDQLSVDNQYGQVKINLWDKKEIRVDVSITANAPTDQRAADYLNAVTISEKREGNVITLRTLIDRSQFGSSNWNSWRSKPGEKNSIQIDYVVNMPKFNALIVRNKFGNTDIPWFQAPLTVQSRYGNFSAEDLGNASNTIEVAYGKAKIGKMDGGKMEIRYSDFDLDQARTLLLINKFGKLTIGEVGSLEADIDYSGATIGRVNESCKVNLSYSGNFQVNQLPHSAENVDIQAAYSSVVLPAESSQFNVTVTHGDFRLPTNLKVNFTNQPSKTDSYRSTKQYSGTVGSGTGTIIKVVSTFGDVRLKD